MQKQEDFYKKCWSGGGGGSLALMNMYRCPSFHQQMLTGMVPTAAGGSVMFRVNVNSLTLFLISAVKQGSVTLFSRFLGLWEDSSSKDTKIITFDE